MTRIAACLILAAGVCASAAPYHANLETALAPFEAVASPRMLMIGDSLTLRDGGPYVFLRGALQSRLGDGGDGWRSMSLWTGGGFDPGWVQGQINADTAPHRSIDGLWASTTTTAWARLDPSPGTKIMRFVVEGDGNFALWNTATNQTTQHTAPGTFDITFPANAGRIWIQPGATGVVTVLGAWCDTQQQGVTISRGANGGWGVQNFLQRDYTFELVGNHIAPDLIWITLGQNDTPEYTPVQYTAAMRQLVQRVRAMAPTAGIVLCASYDSGSLEIQAFSNSVYDAAIAENVGFVNLYRAGGPYEFFEDNNYLADPVHFAPAGGQYVANILNQAIISHGRSLRFCQGDTNQDGTVNGADLSVLLASFGDKGEPWRSGDNNGDSVVDGADLSVLLNTFGCQR